MTTYTSTQYQNVPPTCDEAGCLQSFGASYTFAASTALVIGDIIKLCTLPKGFVLEDLILATDSLGTSCAGSVGFLNAAADDMDQAVIAIGSLATATVKRADTVAGLRVAPSETTNKIIGIKITTANTANAAQGAKVSVTMRYRPKQKIEV